MEDATTRVQHEAKRYNMTERGLASLKAVAGKRFEHADTVVKELCLRVSPTSKSWSVVYRVAGAGEAGRKGKMRRMSLGDYPRVPLARARDLARDALDAAERGMDPATQRKTEAVARNERVFEVVLDRFIEEYAMVEQKEWRSTKSYLERYVLPRWRGRPVDEIRRGDVSALLATVRKEAIANARALCAKAGRERTDARHELSGTSAAREVRKHVRKLFSWAMMLDLVEANPALGYRKGLDYKKRDRVLTMDELRRVWDAAGVMGYPFGDITRLLILTGQRRSEVAEVPDDWVSLDDALVTIPAADYKTGRKHTYPLSAPALAIIKALPRTGGSPFLFPATKVMRRGEDAELRPVSGFSKAKLKLDTIIAKHDAKHGRKPMVPWTFHDIRRSVTTEMAVLKIPGDHIERVLGHVLGGVKEVYQHYDYMPEKRDALDLWGAQWT